MARYTILGAGKMGSAIVRGLIERGGVAPADIRATIRHADRVGDAAAALGVAVGTDNAEAVRAADVVVVATKPRDVVPALAAAHAEGAFHHRPLVISTAAGVPIERLAEALPEGTPLLRAMPNTPCLIGEGMIVLSPAPTAAQAHIDAALAVFRPLGRVRVLDEEHLDTVTALSASGPAFLYVILESLAEGGVMMGLPRAVATELAAQTAVGAARMVLETGRHPASLKDDVTTPAGCTVAGLLAMEDGRIRSVLARTVEVATHAAAGLGAPRKTS